MHDISLSNFKNILNDTLGKIQEKQREAMNPAQERQPEVAYDVCVDSYETFKTRLRSLLEQIADQNPAEVNAAIVTLESLLTRNKIDEVAGLIADILGIIPGVLAHDRTRDELITIVKQLIARIDIIIDEERKDDENIEALRRVHALFGDRLEEFYYNFLKPKK